jgi:hypothetical protein
MWADVLNRANLGIEVVHAFHMLGVAGVFGGSLIPAMHRPPVSFSLIRETTENLSANSGYKFGQEEETYIIVADFPVRVLQQLAFAALLPCGLASSGHYNYGVQPERP